MTSTTPKNPAALDFLRTRRSRPYKTLEAPVPDRGAVEELLNIAARVPDHGKLVPFRFLVLEHPALKRLSEDVAVLAAAGDKEPEDVEKMQFQLASAPLAVAVVASPKPSEKIPEIEQIHSAGSACLALLNAALAAGWGANWVTGWAAHDREFLQSSLGLNSTETLVGFVHIGTARAAPPERPRPDIDDITTWVSA